MKAIVLQISVIVPVFNTSPELLQAAVCSVLSDPSADQAQLVLIDDASTSPSTRHMLDHLRLDQQVLVLRNERNLGPASSRNRGLAAATGDWIGFLDADDVWLPGQFGRWLEMHEAWPDARWLAVGYRSALQDGQLSTAPNLPLQGETGADGMRQLAGPALTSLLVGSFWLHLGATLTERRLVEQAGGFADGLYHSEDMHFVAKLSTLAPLIYHHCEGYEWRRHEAGQMGCPGRLRAGVLRMNKFARRDPLLRAFQREVRWAHYGAVKGVAMNNLLAGRRLHAIGFALRAWAMDPREWRALAFFLRLCAADDAAAQRGLQRYSSAERFTARLSL